MQEDNLVEYRNPGIALPVADALTAVLRQGAQELLLQAIETEVSEFLVSHRELKAADGKQRVVRNGYLPERTIQTGIGDVAVKAPRVRDRAGEIKFSSSILPPYLRRTRSLEELLPWLYLKGLSTSDFSSALTALLGKDAPGLSANTISRLKEVWKGEHEQWSKRSLSGKKYVYIWADGIYFGVRLEDTRQCILVIIGATADGQKEVLGITDGYRESEESWKELLLDLKARGLTIDPKLAIGDGSLGFWKALPQVFGTTRAQRCWKHKKANVLNYLPKGLQAKAKAQLNEISMAESRVAADQAFDHFLLSYEAKYPKATECLAKDRDVLLTFYNFPAEHWQHIRTTNPIESTFGTVRLRTAKTRGCVSRTSMLAMVFKLTKTAEQKWRKLKGHERLDQVVRGVKFKDGRQEEEAHKVAA
ncbi:MAG TPA: IS256 family transposase [Pyrinomonadaceae bacterium]|nr:IS256 family transposase [Pyrinomonadaceae bacterium]